MSYAEHTYFTDDVGEMADLYERLLDEDPVHRDEHLALFDTDTITVLIHQQMDTYEDGPPNEDHPAFAVDDVDETYASLVDDGYEAVTEPADYDWGRAAYVRDPDGRLVELTTE